MGLRLAGLLVAALAAADASGREPVARIVEVTLGDGVPPPCEGVVFSGRVLHLDARLYRTHRAGGTHLILADDVPYLEEARHVVLVRHAEGCMLLAARNALPAPREVMDALGLPLPAFDWRVDAEGRLFVRRAGVEYRLPGGGMIVLAETLTGLVRMAYYGILPLYGAPGRPSARLVAIGDAVSDRFAGPGDVRTYVLEVLQAGMLVVEYRSAAGPGSVDIKIADKGGRTVGRGGAAFPGPGQARVNLQYRGVGPAAFDVSFLFNPDAPLRCTVQATVDAGETVKARLRLENRGDVPVTVQRPGRGTVRWYADGQLVGVARPGVLPRRRLLAPGEPLDYEARLALPSGVRRLAAEVDAGAAGVLRCGAVIQP